MKKFYHFLGLYARLPLVLVGLVLIILFNTVWLPSGLDKIKVTAPDATGPLDLEFTYSAEKAYQMVNSYGEEGRELYLNSVWRVDSPYALIYGFAYTLLLLLLIKKIYPVYKKTHLLALFPFVIFFLDIFENIGITSIIQNYPKTQEGIVQITSMCSSLKWTLAGVLALTILFLLVKLVIKKIRR